MHTSDGGSNYVTSNEVGVAGPSLAVFYKMGITGDLISPS